MNAGIAFISRKSRKTDVAWRYAIAVVLVVCCIGSHMWRLLWRRGLSMRWCLCFRRPRCLKNRPCSGNGRFCSPFRRLCCARRRYSTCSMPM